MQGPHRWDLEAWQAFGEKPMASLHIVRNYFGTRRTEFGNPKH